MATDALGYRGRVDAEYNIIERTFCPLSGSGAMTMALD